jgi:hypothetical protein
MDSRADELIAPYASYWPRLCEKSARYICTLNFEGCGHAESKKALKFVLRQIRSSFRTAWAHSDGKDGLAPVSWRVEGLESGYLVGCHAVLLVGRILLFGPGRSHSSAPAGGRPGATEQMTARRRVCIPDAGEGVVAIRTSDLGCSPAGPVARMLHLG